MFPYSILQARHRWISTNEQSLEIDDVALWLRRTTVISRTISHSPDELQQLPFINFINWDYLVWITLSVYIWQDIVWKKLTKRNPRRKISELSIRIFATSTAVHTCEVKLKYNPKTNCFSVSELFGVFNMFKNRACSESVTLMQILHMFSAKRQNEANFLISCDIGS